MTNPTKGPWVWTGNVLWGQGGEKVIDHADYEGMWFATYDLETDKANAHLIAEAPAMLDMLKQFIDARFDDVGPYLEAEKLIAKAEGKA